MLCNICCDVSGLADTFRYEPSSVAWQSPFWTKMTLSVARHFQVQDKVSSDIVRKDIGGYQTFSSIRLKDIVRCEIFAVVRHLQLSDTFSKRSKRHCLLRDICRYQKFSVVRHFLFRDTFHYQTLSAVRHFPLLNITT